MKIGTRRIIVCAAVGLLAVGVGCIIASTGSFERLYEKQKENMDKNPSFHVGVTDTPIEEPSEADIEITEAEKSQEIATEAIASSADSSFDIDKR